MSHLDEGTLHALLDGELDLQEVREIQAHLGGCSACGTRLQSVKDILAESDRLVGAVQFPGTPRRPAALDPAPVREPDAGPPVVSEPAAPEFPLEREYEPAAPEYQPPQAYEPPPSPRPRRGPERGIDVQPVYDEPPPVLLIPDDHNWSDRRRRVITATRWAALVLVAVGAGYIASEVRRTGGVPILTPSSETPEITDELTAPVVSAEETARPDSATAPPKLAAEPAAGARQSPAPQPLRKAAPPPQAQPALGAAAGQDGAKEREAAPAPADLLARDDAFGQVETPSPDVREEAAEALAELDRQRRTERAAAATAALDSLSQRRALRTRNAAPAEVAPAPAPAPRTLEQRSAVYLRIGLDEAARQLGRPVHVIEGMQPQFMGLAQGAASAGADAGRPVVRVVYQDNQGRMILLDQQRVRPGQTWGAGETRWVIGEIGLWLHGEAGPEILRNLRPRVR